MGCVTSKQYIDYQRLKNYVVDFIETYCEKDVKHSCMFSDFIAAYSTYIFSIKKYSLPNDLNVILFIIESSLQSTYPNTFYMKGMRHIKSGEQNPCYMYISGLKIKQMP
jgi:hypothetical protein